MRETESSIILSRAKRGEGPQLNHYRGQRSANTDALRVAQTILSAQPDRVAYGAINV